VAHVLGIPSVIAAAEHQSHIIRKGDGVYTKAVSREPAPNRNLTELNHGQGRGPDVQRIWDGEPREAWGRIRDRGTAARGLR
jgi:hypothetical protein